MSDQRTLDEVIAWLLDINYLPSFCTACYREGRTGDRFMTLVKQGKISHCCTPNALITLKEYLEDYASPATRAKGEELIRRELGLLPNERIRTLATQRIGDIEHGERDFRF